ncbi:MAG TPA: hypothetical protein ENF49_01855 [Candidatus Altiarchaeales archaeon]|nr:hypothetical protein [Candidatus Altiarchaeales archaeon]HEX54854.1 hypothetical protein [Candidatus Altiarchaeales archaeon]
MDEIEREHDIDESERCKIKDVLEKFSCRYLEDDELQSICDEFMRYLENRDKDLVDRITKDLEELVYIRRLETLIVELRFKGTSGHMVDYT